MFESNEYDRSVNTFSNQGRLYQVEYAMKAVEDGWTSVGIQVKEGVVLAAEKKLSKLQISRTNEKIVKVDSNVIATHSGLLSDARALLEKARVEATNHWFSYDEPMPIESLAFSISNATMSFADKDKKKKDEDREEEKRVARPFGCSILMAGVEEGHALLYRNDPSGNYIRFRACAIGAGSENGLNTLNDNYNEDMSLDEASKLAVRVVKENMQQISSSNLEVSLIRTADSSIKHLSQQERDALFNSL